ncbi:homeodomain-like superfamily protein isoform X2 [Tasmannia lanceolata]|uniref:homeodomain-like superfamily protein isoform X2 n=1 Tax=Tasmannia lanceolata TaxID=3420 RepID=UPI0040640261
MDITKLNLTSSFMELDIGTSSESFQRFLDSQKEVFHSQIDQLQKIVITQCKLTGVNPLSQEMAAGALSIKIGKRPRDLLNPKAVKYMQSVFAIKDTISKKETREISALCGVTVTQVREFFAGQRSRVRRLVRLSREKAIRFNASKASPDGCSIEFTHAVPVSDQVPVNSVDPKNVNSVDPKNVEEAPKCSSQEEIIPGLDSADKNFHENIFILMRKEETFTGQVKLMEWILQTHNSAVLYWFLTKGGIMILATWLSQAALEEQTTVLLVIFKVLSHLPLRKALPVQMSAILQTVNRLRFYRSSDISNRAKVLLSRWSKLFDRSQPLKKPSFSNSPVDLQKEIIRKKRINEILSDESWQSKIDFPEDILAISTDTSESSRKLESAQAIKLRLAPSDDSNKKQVRIISSPQTKERRKVLLVEQSGRKTAGRTVPVARTAAANQGRPMSSDDIQKAKMRAIFMQSKYGKVTKSSDGGRPQRTEGFKLSSTSQTSDAQLVSKSLQPKKEEGISNASETSSALPVSKTFEPVKEVDKEPLEFGLTTLQNLLETSIDSKSKSVLQEPLWEKLKRHAIPWQMPPELMINPSWRFAAGDNSKEVEIQTKRIQREREIIYWKTQDIPSDPKEPWDVEMDFDDSLTPEIPTEQPPDVEVSSDVHVSESSPRIDRDSTPGTSTTTPIPFSDGNSEPDFELLAVLLKNPELVLALTSGQGNSFSSAETVALLDMLKSGGVGLAGNPTEKSGGVGGLTGILNGLAGNATERPGGVGLSGILTGSAEKPGFPSDKPEPMSLPSPTPPSDPVMRWKLEPPVSMPEIHGKPTIAQFLLASNREGGVSSAIPLPEKLQTPSSSSSSMLQLPITIDPLQRTPVINPSLEKLAPLNPTLSHLNPIPMSNSFPSQNLTPTPPESRFQPNYPSQHQLQATFSSSIPISVTEPNLRTKNFPLTSPPLLSITINSSLSQQAQAQGPEGLNFGQITNQRPSPTPILSNPSKERPLTHPSLAPLLPIPLRQQQQAQPQSFQWPQNSSTTRFSVGQMTNQNNYNSLAGGPIGLFGGRTQFTGEPELESWSPERSPTRSPEFRPNRNFPEPRRDFGRSSRPEWPRHRTSGGRRDHRQDNRRWRDRDRSRDRRY